MTIDSSGLSNLEMAELLKWWQQQQVNTLQQEADFIRNDVLQEVLAIRRNLELAHQVPADEQILVSNRHLAQLEKIYALLEQLSARIDPPYFRDSLPMALRHAAESWNVLFHAKTNLPETWTSGSTLQKRLLINFVNTLCASLSAADLLPQDCEITLRQRVNLNELTFSATYSDLPPPDIIASVMAEISPILKTFRVLAHSNHLADSQGCCLRWILQWSAQSFTELT